MIPLCFGESFTVSISWWLISLVIFAGIIVTWNLYIVSCIVPHLRAQLYPRQCRHKRFFPRLGTCADLHAPKGVLPDPLIRQTGERSPPSVKSNFNTPLFLCGHVGSVQKAKENARTARQKGHLLAHQEVPAISFNTVSTGYYGGRTGSNNNDQKQNVNKTNCLSK